MKNIIVLATLLISTILNKYIVSDPDINWTIAMISISFCLLVYSGFEWYETNNKTALILFCIFFSEFLAVCFGWNLSTNYYTEYIIALLVSGLFIIIKRHVRL